MNANEFQNDALKFLNLELTYDQQLENGLMGLVGESGEAIDILKKHKFQGHDLDIEHLAKELSDVSWYLAISAFFIGYDLEDIFKMNIEKLSARYPDGFSIESSTHRKEGDI